MSVYVRLTDFPDYGVTADGRVISYCSGKPRELRPRRVRGYFEVGLWHEHERHPRYVHRLVLEAFRGPCPSGCETRHLNGNRTDNRLSNLVWGTSSENSFDQVRHGTHPRMKLTRDQVREIRARYAAGGVFQRTLAREYGVSQPTISQILRRRSGHDLP